MKLTATAILALIFIGTIRLAQWLCALFIILFIGAAGYEMVRKAAGTSTQKRAAA